MPPIWKPSRTRRILKWTGLLLCVLIAGVWVWSLPLGGAHAGLLVICHQDEIELILTCGTIGWREVGCRRGWIVRRNYNTSQLNFFKKTGLIWPRVGARPGAWLRGYFPLWLPILILATPTAILWVRDRGPKRYPPGHCRFCGYDLTGNVSGICSECGTACEDSTQTESPGPDHPRPKA